MEIKNKHLKKLITSELVRNPTEDFLKQLSGELKFSTLLSPVVFRDENNFEWIIHDFEDKILVSCFTDEEEFKLVSSQFDDNVELVPFPIEYYYDLLENEDFGGLILNHGSSDIFITRQLLEIGTMNFSTNLDNNEDFAWDEDALKDLLSSLSNESLEKFIGDIANKNNFNELFNEFYKAFLLTAVGDTSDLSSKAKDGVICGEDIGGFQLCTCEEDSKIYALLFTSVNEIKHTENVYAQFCDVSLICDHLLRADMDGLIINPDNQKFIIPREVLIENSFSIQLTHNPRLNKAINYAFLID